ncbi:hypothetical protein QAD02_000280 [Eretmocerus hayati]|uniref:Uncharacterized protein n=1 Tax=Eretmocerus hayati TaxID=131215 RepID=A0ACC2ND52_9HYME|nr:hypothetical protein QAD02_000280 [Eretmocerus hayati]
MEICEQTQRPREKPPSILDIKNKIRLSHDECCNCCCCKIPEFKAYRYIQPERRKSFQPEKCYVKSDVPLEDQTTYKLSFWPGPIERQKPFVPEGCLTVAPGRITHDTTHKMSYVGNWCVKPQGKIQPCARNLFGRGPMQRCTTQKCDFRWLYGARAQPYNTRGNICFPKDCLSDDTTYKLSFFPADCVNQTKSFKPERVYEPSDAPLGDHTTYRLSFFPTEPGKKEEYPWKPNQKYEQPTTPLEGCTTYKLSYWPQCAEKVQPMTQKENENLLNRGPCFDDNTTYCLSYFGSTGEKVEQVKPEGNLTVSKCPMTHDTINKMSYLGNWCPKPQKRIQPCTRQLLGRGPMQDCTTQKCDFRWLCGEKLVPTKPEGNLVFSPAPLECCTTNKLSYMRNCPEALIPNESYKPVRKYCPSDARMDTDTINQLSYQPFDGIPKVDKPWAGKNTWHKPTDPIDDNTTSKLSYMPPGILVPYCEDDEPICPPAPKSCSSSMQPQVSSSNQTPCICEYSRFAIFMISI